MKSDRKNQAAGLRLAGLLLAFLFLLLPVTTVRAGELSREDLLALQGSLFWQRINAARREPLAEVARLGLDVEQVRMVLGDDAWILDRGLPPLAWNNQLFSAGAQHGRDMLSRLYYAHDTPEGLGPMERIAATGYQAAREDETLGILVFGGHVDMQVAVDFLFDAMLRDELTGTPGVHRNILAPELTEMGLAIFAEAVPLVAGQPYVYLLVLDFAAPVIPRTVLVGQTVVGGTLLLKNSYTQFWTLVPVDRNGLFQFLCPVEASDLRVVYPEGGWEDLTVYDDEPGVNRYLDLTGKSD